MAKNNKIASYIFSDNNIKTFNNNRYKVIDKIGEGGFGEVHLANDLKNNNKKLFSIFLF